MKRYIENRKTDSKCNFQIVEASRSEGSEDLQAALAHFAALLNDLSPDCGSKRQRRRGVSKLISRSLFQRIYIYIGADFWVLMARNRGLCVTGCCCGAHLGNDGYDSRRPGNSNVAILL